MTLIAEVQPDVPDLHACEREPIRVPGSIQPHGLLLAVEAVSLRVVRASANVDAWLGLSVAKVLGRPLADVLGADAATAVARVAPRLVVGMGPTLVRTASPVGGGDDARQLLAHRWGELVILELEQEPTEPLPVRLGDEDSAARPDDSPYSLVQTLVGAFAPMSGQAELCAVAAREVRRMTGFDRVMVYRFNDNWDGTVVAEDRNDELPSYLDLRFPASDIPAQARELYRLNKIRLIPDADYEAVPILAAAGDGGADSANDGDRSLDLTFSGLRSVSPVHLEYMRNMRTASSMSVSIVQGDKLWGLISCHHHRPRRASFHVRTACEFVGQVLAMQLASDANAAQLSERIGLKTIQGRLLARMAGADDFVAGLAEDAEDLLGLANAAGAAVASAGGECVRVGAAPSEGEIRGLIDWLEHDVRREVYATDRLSEVYPAAAGYADLGSGLLAVSFSKLKARYMLWFRPEVVRTVKWGGDPNKPMDVDRGGTGGRIHPRQSFEEWKETVRDRSTPWRPTEIEAAAELRNNVVGIVLRRAEELAELNVQLQASNQELEAFSYSVSHDLRAPFRHIVGYAELLREQEAGGLDDTGKRYVETIIESAHYAGTLVDNLLLFSQMGRSALSMTTVDMTRMVAEVRREFEADVRGRTVRWDVAPLPVVRADLMMLRLVVRNLLSNAVKYTRGRAEATIEVGHRVTGAEHVFWVRDNGVGFDMTYVDKLFGVFQRLHRMEDFEGTGIGLANVRRIVTRHGGRAWAEGEVGVGATFWFTLPTNAAPADEPSA